MRASLSRPETWLARWGDLADPEESHDRHAANHLAMVVREALKNDDEGWWEDHSAYLSDWGFVPDDIRVPVQLWHGVDDQAVGIQHGQWLAEHIPSVEAHLVSGVDHTNIETRHEGEAWVWLGHHR